MSQGKKESLVVPENLFSKDCDNNLFSEDYDGPTLLGEGFEDISSKSRIESFFCGDSSENIFVGVVYESILPS